MGCRQAVDPRVCAGGDAVAEHCERRDAPKQLCGDVLLELARHPLWHAGTRELSAPGSPLCDPVAYGQRGFSGGAWRWAQVAVIALWLLLVLPLTLAGNLVGRHWGGRADFPCRVNAVPRVVSPTPWCADWPGGCPRGCATLTALWVRTPQRMHRYLDGVVLWVLSGVLPFGSIFIEMYFVFTSFWAYKIYYVYGFMLLVFGILAVVASCVTIVTVYLQLNMEDYRWYAGRGWASARLAAVVPWLTPGRQRRCM